MADDLGYTDLGVYGSEIETPNLDALARSGVMFTDFYAAATCSPTRAMLLTGKDNHRVGLGTMTDDQTPNQMGQPGYEAYLRPDQPTFVESLQAAGYHTLMSGKWHLGGAEDTRPSARGFDRSFALINGGAGHFDDLPLFAGGTATYLEDGEPFELPEDFYSTRFYTQRMIEYIDAGRDDGRPFFGYLTYTAPHWPLQAPAESVARQAGRYDEGYEVLHRGRVAAQRRLGLIPADALSATAVPGQRAWAELSEEERRRESRTMEIYAAMVADLDEYVGQLMSHLEEIGELDNTFIFFLSDNGAEGHDLEAVWPQLTEHIAASCDNSYENMGRGNSYLYYGPGWARAGTGIFSLYKSFAGEGGIRVPAFVSMPSTFAGERQSRAFGSILDIMPTILELADMSPSIETGRDMEALPMHGRSMMPHLLEESETIHGSEEVMVWELFGRRAVRQGDWKLTFNTPPLGPGRWQLFNIANDPGETLDLAGRFRDERALLLAYWEAYVEKMGVILPEVPIPY
jgi:arylsulfatase